MYLSSALLESGGKAKAYQIYIFYFFTFFFFGKEFECIDTGYVSSSPKLIGNISLFTYQLTKTFFFF